VGQADHASSQKLANKDILEMQAAGLSSEVIVEKIKTSACNFDTTPAALVELKKAGVAEPIILAMMRSPSYKSQSPPLPLKADVVVSEHAVVFKG
jgi:cobalamin biosynthesis Co2+ chelatase CbiK